MRGGRTARGAELRDGEDPDREYEREAIDRTAVRDLWRKVDEEPDLSVGVLGAQVSVTTSGGTPFRSAVGVDDTELGDDATYESYVQCIRRDVNGRGREDIETYTADVKFHRTARRLPEGRRNAILRTIDGLEGRAVRSLTHLL